MQPSLLSDDLTIEFSTEEFSAHAPSEYFAGMAEMLDALQSLDANLVAFALPNGRTLQRIEQINTGSIKLRIASLIEHIPDDVLKTGDYKRIYRAFPC